MTEPKPMTEEEVCAAVDAEINNARILRDGKVGTERSLAYQYYFGEPFGNEETGRSQIVSQLVMEVVDSMMPDLVKIFCAGEKVVEFVARKPQDVQLAQQATEVCNYVFYTQNDGFRLVYEAIKDALLLKTGVWKYWWEVEQKVEEETFEALTMGQITLLKQDKGVEIVAASQRMDIVAAEPLYDVTVKRTKEAGKICIETVPPEELLVSTKARSVDVQSLPFVAHETRKTLSDLVEMGVCDVEQALSLASGDHSETLHADLAIDRQTRNEGLSIDTSASGHDPMLREVTYIEAYQYLDVDGDGISELRKICKVGEDILANETTERIPFAVITPKIMPHEFFGVSLADDSMDLQLLKSTLWRMQLDGLYLALYPRQQVVESMVTANTYADLMAPGPGRPVRVKAVGAVTPMEVPYVGDAAMPMMEFLEQEVEGRTPVNRQYQGLPDNALNKTATSASIVSSRSTARTELIARIFAETGFKDLFRGITWLLGKYQQEPMIVRISGQYMPIDPRAWKNEYDMTVNVGLGLGSKQEQLMLLQSIEMAQAQVAQSPLMGALLTPKNLYALQAKKAQLSGFKDPNLFWTQPPDNWQPPQPGPPPEVQVAQMKLQGEQQKLQVTQQADVQKFHAEQQAKQQQLTMEMQVKQREQENAQAIQASNDARDNAKMQLEHERELQRMAIEAELKREEMAMQAQLKREEMNLNAQVSAHTAQISSEATVKSAAAKAPPPKDDGDLKAALKQLAASHSTPKRAKRNPDGSWDVRPAQ